VLETIFGNGTAEKVLLYILVHREAYARELALAFELPISVIQKQLVRLERGGVLASTTKGRTRLFQLSPVYPFVAELEALLRRALAFVPNKARTPYEPRRSRPRATGKPLR
jgi:DNA-binding transcriptional ArsR family regulator